MFGILEYRLVGAARISEPPWNIPPGAWQRAARLEPATRPRSATGARVHIASMSSRDVPCRRSPGPTAGPEPPTHLGCAALPVRRLPALYRGSCGGCRCGGGYVVPVERDSARDVGDQLRRLRREQGKTLMERPILAPTALPAEVQVMYVGLNPSIARSTVAAMDWLRERNIQLVYLDGEPS